MAQTDPALQDATVHALAAAVRQLWLKLLGSAT